MECVVNPWLWYWVEWLNSAKEILELVSAPLGAASLILIITAVVWNLGKNTSEPDKKSITRLSIIITILFLIVGTAWVFCPKGDTILKMYVSKKVTYNTIEGAKDMTNDIRETIKQDVIEILQEVNKQKDE